MNKDYQKITEQVISLTHEVAKYIGNECENFSMASVETKSKNDFVSYVDQESEKKIVSVLRQILPEAGFLTEEGTAVANNEDYIWVIDPLDGTTNFIHQSTPYAISIGLMHKNKPVVGVIYEITHDETFYAWENSPAYLDGKVIHVSNAQKLSESLIATGRPHHYMQRFDKLMHSFEYFLKETHGIRTSGSAASDLAYLACGRYDGRYEFNLKPWDIAAGVIIVQQAGGHVCDFKGGDNYFSSGEVIASNHLIFDELKSKVNELFY